MARYKDTNPAAIASLLLAAGLLAMTVYLTQRHPPSSLVMADTGDGHQLEQNGAQPVPLERKSR